MALGGAAYVWALAMPINKKIWTSSYALLSTPRPAKAGRQAPEALGLRAVQVRAGGLGAAALRA